MADPDWNSWIIEVRKRLENPPARRLPPGDGRKASILVPLYVDAGELWTFLTRRTDDLPYHKGQIAFPGGSLEEGEDFWEAALRETEEEVGLDKEVILPLGELDEAETPSGFRIVPCVGAVPFPMETEPNDEEVDEILAVPLSAFANPRAVEERAVVVDGEEHAVRIYHVANRPVWGLTARIVQNLLVRLGLEPAEEGVN